ncbi:glycoside hydrolase family 3 protein [Microbacterium sp. SYP-A9085]|uniref:glycoside hydrolase family 3 N-terminal domain-containing protein n=1 Tax=Microbacterium sp. SYP-A9085 TaxID=2664454 RepID=UPI00129ADD4E|nr:glycoside hydrolase family 3 N-terminal domain-containing protein [Microbacterium sp. SYP-A9085]MRH28244.1 glycoside hydrolase family 3 protein [Microbacterium sp. SYP-A9085]
MRLRTAAVLVTALVALTACAPLPTATPGTSPPVSTTTPTPTPTPTPVDPIARLTLPQRVGQLFMVGTGTGSAAAGTLAAVADRHVGGVFLHSGTRTSLTRTASLVGQFTRLVSPTTTGGIPLWVATDQEGGDVQVLSGPGYTGIPSALRQGALTSATLQTDAVGWGGQLAQTGVDVNLAPVADIVTSPALARRNAPIGLLNRQYGYDERTVARAAGAFADGMRQAGVLPAFKHFPGLGRTDSNTDFEPAVDTAITADAPDVDVYRSLLAGGPALVMVSTAVYERIDPSAPAVFSPRIVGDLLREKVGFDGVVITDDLSAAAAVGRWTPAQRATMAIDAGCDILLLSSGPELLPQMYEAVLAKAVADPVFAGKVDAAARRVVIAKAAGVGG